MDVSDAIVVLVGPRSDFFPSDKDVLELSSLILSLDLVDNVVTVVVCLNVESCVPLPIFEFVAHCLAHGKMKSVLQTLRTLRDPPPFAPLHIRTHPA